MELVGGGPPPYDHTGSVRKRVVRLRCQLTDDSMRDDRDSLRMWRVVIPNMVKWLPDDEAEAVKAELLPRIEALLA